MGIGNRCPIRDPLSGVDFAHYPSWGSETAWLVGSWEASRSAHYPSWGSETATVCPECGAAHGLITPHGDRKQDDVQAGRYVRSLVSLPLMGIGNVLACGATGGTGMPSLPLMGIGNEPQVKRTHAERFDAHYPSWGSETQRVWRLPRSSRSAHYPSWGSETFSESDTGFDQAPFYLITPHGDRKLTSAARSDSVAHFSLPLMGIGNLRGAEVDRAGAGHLITPHGDRKLDLLVRQPPTALMLITPHGDRKRAATASANRFHADSLPLMGIGNAARALGLREVPVHAHYPSWGSETKTNSLCKEKYDELITPHGDRKPAW